jgi:AcrR family transcriptional regulator
MKSVGATRPYNQVARAASQQRTREALLDAAECEFLRGDWQHASLEAIASDAGTTKQTLLRHFGSKGGLLGEATRRGLEQVRAQRFGAPRGDLAAAVENLLEHYEQWGERALRIGAIQDRSPASAKLAQTARQVHHEWVEHAFGPWLESLRGKSRLRTRGALIALCDVHTWWVLSHDLEMQRDDVRTTLIDMVERLLRVEK